MRLVKPLLAAPGVAVLALGSALLSADDASSLGWKTDVDLGFVNTSGNTKTTSLQGKIDTKQTLQNWENQFIISALFKEDQITKEDDQGVKSKVTEKTAEKYFASAKTAYLLGVEKSYLFAYGSHTRDEFGAYRDYSTVAVGYGDWLYSSPKVQWFIEAGPGYFEGKKVDKDDESITNTERGAILRAATQLVWKVSSNAEFKQLLSTEHGSDNTRTISETSLSASITDAMKMKVGVNVANDSDVAVGKKKTDTTTFVNLVYSF